MIQDQYIGKQRFQLASEAKRRRYHQSPSNAKVIDWAISEIKRYIDQGPVLDLACGNGRHTKDLVSGSLMVCAGDISFAMLKAAREHLGDDKAIRALRLDAENLPYPDGAFEVTFSARFFHHLPEPVRARILGEIFRVRKNAALVTMKKRGSFEHIRTIAKYILKGKPFQYQRFFCTVGEFDRVAHSHGWMVKKAVSPFPILSANCAVLFEPINRSY
ncbi:MAG: class I SAM-dependent methyltransferase [Candidatus Omnitrophica bacterium]|nr:class I SAM-dependent methyltransferase [Candidatus Omnitrophota bacterium]